MKIKNIKKSKVDEYIKNNLFFLVNFNEWLEAFVIENYNRGCSVEDIAKSFIYLETKNICKDRQSIHIYNDKEDDDLCYIEYKELHPQECIEYHYGVKYTFDNIKEVVVPSIIRKKKLIEPKKYFSGIIGKKANIIEFVKNLKQIYCMIDYNQALNVVKSVCRFLNDIKNAVERGVAINTKVLMHYSDTHGTTKSTITNGFYRAFEKNGFLTSYGDIDNNSWVGREYSENQIILIDDTNEVNLKNFSGLFKNIVDKPTGTYNAIIRGKGIVNELPLRSVIMCNTNYALSHGAQSRCNVINFTEEISLRGEQQSDIKDKIIKAITNDETYEEIIMTCPDIKELSKLDKFKNKDMSMVIILREINNVFVNVREALKKADRSVSFSEMSMVGFTAMASNYIGKTGILNRFIENLIKVINNRKSIGILENLKAKNKTPYIKYKKFDFDYIADEVKSVVESGNDDIEDEMFEFDSAIKNVVGRNFIDFNNIIDFLEGKDNGGGDDDNSGDRETNMDTESDIEITCKPEKAQSIKEERIEDKSLLDEAVSCENKFDDVFKDYIEEEETTKQDDEEVETAELETHPLEEEDEDISTESNTEEIKIKLERKQKSDIEDDEIYNASLKSSICKATSIKKNDREFLICSTPKDNNAREFDRKEGVSRFMLFEIDNIGLKEQRELIESLPPEIVKSVYMVVFSGNKSLHTIISCGNNFNLDSEDDKRRYRLVCQYINRTYFKGLCDEQCFCIGKTFRAPFQKREGRKDQLLLYYNKNAVICDDIICKVKYEKPKARVIIPTFSSDETDFMTYMQRCADKNRNRNILSAIEILRTGICPKEIGHQVFMAVIALSDNFKYKGSREVCYKLYEIIHEQHPSNLPLSFEKYV